MQPSSPRAEHRLEQAWRGRGVLAALLLIPALGFVVLRGIRQLAYRVGLLHVARLPVPVVVVGNLSVGGTGKTPLVIHLAQTLGSAGERVGIVSRGYGRTVAAPHLVATDDAPAAVGDEPLLIRRRAGCPVAVGRDRVAAARLLLERHPETTVILSDDGLQHLRLGRDLEVAVLADDSLGNRWPLPAGPLRDPLSRLGSVDAVAGVEEAVALASTFRRPAFRLVRRIGVAYRLGDPAQPLDVGTLRGQTVHAVAGIAHPERFFSGLAGFGVEAVPHGFADHHAYRASDLDFGGGVILTTEKDAVKFAGLDIALPVWVVPLEIDTEPGLAAFLLEKLHGRPPA